VYKTWQEIIDPEKIDKAIADTEKRAKDPAAVRDVLAKAKDRARLHGIPIGQDSHEYVQGLDLEDAATLLNISTSDPESAHLLQELYDTALEIKQSIYGNRIVLFAPLYLANYCVNSCTYCAFRSANKHVGRSALTKEELIQEVIALEKQGHRRLLVLTGEHPKYTFDQFLDALHTIKSVESPPCGKIRRMNVEIPSLSVSDFRRLKATDCVGTYTLFQETYDPRIYKRFHPYGPKSDYGHRLLTMDRAQIAGIDDVGIGALFGLTDYRFEVLGMLMHAQHLDTTYKAGPHTISIPRLQPADSAPDAIAPPAAVNDADFKKLVAVLRCAVPYTGMILSTRESPQVRRDLLHIGISQMSAGSRTDVGAYHKEKMQPDESTLPAEVEIQQTLQQFQLQDHRSVDEIIGGLIEDGFLPSFCTACYRKHRTGEAFMKIAKTGKIQDFCHPNSLLTLQEYLDDYASPGTRELGSKLIERESTRISENAQRALKRKMEKIKQGERDLYF
jgi:[FeFe] hydrogenase H-cluster radical SAM maturase HydG